ncbi:MAG: hypothetical protein HYY40_08745 [Bacteroidetes bacterium]|nr:hypothetical protein [Bacteroidota bacterium]
MLPTLLLIPAFFNGFAVPTVRKTIDSDPVLQPDSAIHRPLTRIALSYGYISWATLLLSYDGKNLMSPLILNHAVKADAFRMLNKNIGCGLKTVLSRSSFRHDSRVIDLGNGFYSIGIPGYLDNFFYFGLSLNGIHYFLKNFACFSWGFSAGKISYDEYRNNWRIISCTTTGIMGSAGLDFRLTKWMGIGFDTTAAIGQ